MTHVTCALAVILLLVATTPVVAQDAATADILALVDRAFSAINNNDGDALRATQIANGRANSLRPAPSGEAGRWIFSTRSNEETTVGMDGSGPPLLERWTAEPTVLVRGPIAVVWGEYDLWIDGEFSHCGVDAIDLVRLDNQWIISNWAWTVELDDCPTDPANGE